MKDWQPGSVERGRSTRGPLANGEEGWIGWVGITFVILVFAVLLYPWKRRKP